MVHIANINKRGKYKNAHVGTYIPMHPEKYCGTTKPIYKSDLEHRFMMYVDRNPNVVSWIYEPQSIPYFDKSTNKMRRYFIDFTIVIKNGNFRKTIWVEIKPSSEIEKPKNLRNAKAYSLWLKNQSKWETATVIAKQKGYEFHVISEKELN